jgi:hypothetical protein
MSEDLFKRTRSLLLDHIRFLDQHSIGDTRADQAQVIVDEIDILLKSEELKSIEKLLMTLNVRLLVLTWLMRLLTQSIV